ncbi:MAG: hypothetical protein EOP19_32470 [Hyphomicrobiales bacterium]|nr:MAG: hypothetical protein EOP19_32470 [Hyphomicrobiales bacterium]
MTTHTLTRHQDIQNWVAGRHGLPGIRRIPDSNGVTRPRLTLSFAGHQPAPSSTPTQDDGISPCSWHAWLAELDRQHLALRVSQDEDYEFIERKDLN